MDDDEQERVCPDCEAPGFEVVTSVSFESCIESDAGIDVELVCFGDTKYVGLRLTDVEDAGEAVKWIIDSGGLNSVGVVWHASTARQIAAAILNAADRLDGLIEVSAPDDISELGDQ